MDSTAAETPRVKRKKHKKEKKKKECDNSTVIPMDSTAAETPRVKRKKHKKEKKKKRKREKKECDNEWCVENEITKSNDLNTTKCDATFNSNDVELEEDDFYDFAEEEVEFEPSFLHFNGHCFALTAKQKEAAREKGIVIKYGKWDEKEDEILKRNWKNFVKRYNLKRPQYLIGLQLANDPNVIRFVHAKKFHYQLGKDLDNRPMLSIYTRARNLFNPFKNRYKTTSDVLVAIKDLMPIYGNSWTAIGNLLQRRSMNIREIVSWRRKEKVLGCWSQEEDENLIQAIKKVLQVEDVASIYQGIPWEEVAKLIPTRNGKQCRKHWMFNLCWNVNNPNVPREKWNDENTVNLIKCIYHLPVESEIDIDWIEIFNKFSNVASYSALHHKWGEIKQKVPRYEEKDFEDIVLYLYKVYVPILVKKLGKSSIDEVLSAS